MLHRQLLVRQLRASLTHPARQRTPVRCIATQPEQQQKSWLTRTVESSPVAKKWFLRLTSLFGYGNPKQLAGRRALILYEHVVAATPDVDRAFWQNECYLPPTFQSWFTVTNLHIWMLTVRLRSLPKEHGHHYVQALIDHFFIDVEDRIRAVLQPPIKPTPPYTFHSSFYINPNASDISDASPEAKSKPRGRAPDRIVTRQMKIFKEQWAGLGLSFDLALVKGDMEMAGAVWRNLLGARGARGITFPDPSSSSPENQNHFRRAVNLAGGEVVNISKIDIEKEETRDDGSGVHDFPPSEVDKYLNYPELMFDIVGYVRRELARLDKISDRDILTGKWEKLQFGPIKQPRL